MGICNCCKKELSESQRKTVKGVKYKSCPNCSQKNGEYHIFYPDPNSFGTTPLRATKNNPDGIQSHCTPCRGGFPPEKGKRCDEL